MKENSLMEKVNNEVSPYDASYPIMLLSKGIKNQLQMANKAVDAIYKVALKEAPLAFQLKQATNKGFRYVVDASDEVLKAIDSGKIKLMTTKSGKVTAQIVHADGTFGDKLGIKKETFCQGVKPVEMSNALQMMVLQEQLQEITNQIISIDRSVKDVLQGQQNDRLGLYYSGLAMYLEARSTENIELQRALITQALRSLTDASFKLIVTMQSDIKYLVDEKYNQEKGKRKQLIDERMHNINESFEFVHQAAMLRAAIYCEQNEIRAMATVLNEYSHFIETSISQNAMLLAQCDVSDSGTDQGIWQTRANLRLDVSEIIKNLENKDKVLYLGITEEEKNG